MVNIKYTYDASANRISKQVTNSSGNVVYTWYVRDARGNVMSTYTSTGTGSTLSSYTVDLSGQYLYGSSRLGILNRSVNMKTAYTQEEVVSFYRGYKQYELSNHLGNVWITITDKKTGVSTNGTTVNNYTADVSTASDYFPFGMRMPGRTYTATGTKYKYGFNGKENDNEVKGEGNQLDYGMRIYDPRLGRFLSVDPLTSKYPMLTPYQFASNTPIQAIDLDGKEGVINTIKVNNQPVVDVLTYHVVIATTNNLTASNKAYYTGPNYQNTSALQAEIQNALNSVYNQNKNLADVVTNPNTVNGSVPVYYNFIVSTFSVENVSIGDKKRQLYADQNVSFIDNVQKFSDDDGDVTNFSLLTKGALSGKTVGSFTRPSVTIDETHFKDRNNTSVNYESFQNTVAHEIGHGLLRRHPNVDVREPSLNEALQEFNHNFAPGLGGIFRYGILTNRNTTLLIPPSKNITQPNTDAMIKSATKGSDINIQIPSPQ
ncbi:MAG: hypothetical protein M9904_14595 [Chitinophagaceae bacterium]|nr:hypothetical protein [Chitinophagaceae bacterium]MCO5241276.1 hypothetical protein [Chitinophagaceae bacterium]